MKQKLKNAIGTILVAIQPKKAAALTKNGMTIEWYHKLSMQERLMRSAILKKAENMGDFEALAEFHRNYWTHKGADFFSQTDDSFEHIFLPHCAFIFDHLQEQLSKDSSRFGTLIEIGTGNGKVLQYLESKFSQIDKFIGIDLSKDQIRRNKIAFQENKRLEFVASDAYDWIGANGHGNMVVVTSLGVLEYFTEKRLQAFLDLLNGLGKVIFVAIEPNGATHDFSVNPSSEPYGHERSFSHNYPALFKNAGFTLWHRSQKILGKNEYISSFIGAKK